MLRKALLYTWFFYSALALFTIVFSLLLPDELVYQTAPQCYSVKQFGKECFMCGSTRSFVAIGNGQWQKAWGLNRLSVFLYAFILINSIAVIYYTVTNSKQIKS